MRQAEDREGDMGSRNALKKAAEIPLQGVLRSFIKQAATREDRSSCGTAAFVLRRAANRRPHEGRVLFRKLRRKVIAASVNRHQEEVIIRPVMAHSFRLQLEAERPFEISGKAGVNYQEAHVRHQAIVPTRVGALRRL